MRTEEEKEEHQEESPNDRDKAYAYMNIIKMLDRCLYVDLKDRDNISIENEILKNDILQKSRLYGAKPHGFRYEITERDTSLVHRTMQEKIVNYENAKVEVEQKKIHIKAKTPYSDQKMLDSLKPDIENFCLKVKEIKKILEAINSTPSINEDEKRAFITGINGELQNSIRNGKLSTTTIKHLHLETIRKKNQYELEMKPTPEQEEAHNHKNKNKLKNN